MTGRPCAPQLRRLWAQGTQGRREWALTAYDRFCSELSPWTRGSLPEARKETTIVLFGPTQVGKTTLLLELLGIAEAHLPHVSDVLRGGREIGSSATATPMLYDESPSERWKLDDGGQARELDDADAKQALMQVRGRVEAGVAEVRSVKLDIPARYFGPDRGDAPRVRILDLPGVNPANANEAEHVRRVTQAYVPTADLVILITRADDLGFLQPSTLKAQGLGALDWTVSPARFCIVTSFAFTLDTVQTWLALPGATPDVAALRSRFAEQMRSFGMEVDDPDLLYPLDFGTSWRNAPSERRARVEPLMTELRRKLRARIAGTAQELGRLRNVGNVYHLAVKIQATELKRLASARDDCSRQLERTAVTIEGWRNARDRRKWQLNALPGPGAIRHASQILQARINGLVDATAMPLPAVDDEDAMTRGTLLGIARRLQTKLSESLSDLITQEPETDEAEAILKILATYHPEATISKGAAAAFASFKRDLDSYYFEDYWLFVPGRSFAEDRARLSRCIVEAQAATLSELGNACGQATRIREAVVAGQRRRLQGRLQRLDKRITRLEVERGAFEAALVRGADEMAELQRSLERDRRRVEQFKELLRAALCDDLQTRREVIVAERRAARRFLLLLEAVAVCDRAHSLLEETPTADSSPR